MLCIYGCEFGRERKSRRKKRKGDMHGKQDADTVIKIIRKLIIKSSTKKPKENFSCNIPSGKLTSETV